MLSILLPMAKVLSMIEVYCQFVSFLVVDLHSPGLIG